MLSQQNLLNELGVNAVECHSLSRLLQQAYQSRYDPLELQQSLNKHQESLSNPLKHKERDEPSMQFIVNNRNNYSLDMYKKIQLTDQDLILVHSISISLFSRFFYFIHCMMKTLTALLKF